MCDILCTLHTNVMCTNFIKLYSFVSVPSGELDLAPGVGAVGPPGMLLNDLPDRALRREPTHIALAQSAFPVFVVCTGIDFFSRL